MNVALTRARSSIWILGDSNKLRSNQYWSNLVGDAETRGLFRNVRSASSLALLVDQMLTSISVSHRSISTLSDPATRRHLRSHVLFPSSSRKLERSRCHQLTDRTLPTLYDPPIQPHQTESQRTVLLLYPPPLPLHLSLEPRSVSAMRWTYLETRRSQNSTEQNQLHLSDLDLRDYPLAKSILQLHPHQSARKLLLHSLYQRGVHLPSDDPLFLYFSPSILRSRISFASRKLVFFTLSPLRNLCNESILFLYVSICLSQAIFEST